MKVMVVEVSEVSGDANGVPGYISMASGRTCLVVGISSHVTSSTITPDAD